MSRRSSPDVEKVAHGFHHIHDGPGDTAGAVEDREPILTIDDVRREKVPVRENKAPCGVPSGGITSMIRRSRRAVTNEGKTGQAWAASKHKRGANSALVLVSCIACGTSVVWLVRSGRYVHLPELHLSPLNGDPVTPETWI